MSRSDEATADRLREAAQGLLGNVTTSLFLRHCPCRIDVPSIREIYRLNDEQVTSIRNGPPRRASLK